MPRAFPGRAEPGAGWEGPEPGHKLRKYIRIMFPVMLDILSWIRPPLWVGGASTPVTCVTVLCPRCLLEHFPQRIRSRAAVSRHLARRRAFVTPFSPHPAQVFPDGTVFLSQLSSPLLVATNVTLQCGGSTPFPNTTTSNSTGSSETSDIFSDWEVPGPDYQECVSYFVADGDEMARAMARVGMASQRTLGRLVVMLEANITAPSGYMRPGSMTITNTTIIAGRAGRRGAWDCCLGLRLVARRSSRVEPEAVAVGRQGWGSEVRLGVGGTAGGRRYGWGIAVGAALQSASSVCQRSCRLQLHLHLALLRPRCGWDYFFILGCAYVNAVMRRRSTCRS